MKMKLGTKSTKECPECGGETVIETVKDFFGERKVRRCDNLIEVDENKPLDACLWEEEIYGNGKPVPNFIS